MVHDLQTNKTQTRCYIKQCGTACLVRSTPFAGSEPNEDADEDEQWNAMHDAEGLPSNKRRHKSQCVLEETDHS